jgi:EmrB/QacA subfamily drug resistance transporter
MAAEPAAGRAPFLALFSAVMLPMFMGAVDQTLLATATPRIAAELGGLDGTPWIAAGYLLAATVSAPLYGRLGDRFSRRGVLRGALVIFALGSLACAFAGSMPVLVAARVLQGLGGGGLMVLSQALIGELVPPWERPRYQGYFAIVFTASSVGGPLLGGVVVNHGDWRWLFMANLPLAAFALWRVSLLPKAPPHEGRHAPHDPAGFALFVVCAVTALVWAGQAGRGQAFASPLAVALLAVALATGVLLWRQQRGHPNAFLPVDVLRLPGVAWVCLSVIGFAATLFALVFLLPIYLHLAHGSNAVDTGLQLLPLTGGIVVGSTLNGRLTRRTSRTGLLPPYGLGLAAVALLVLAVAPPSPAAIAVIAGACGIGFGTVMPNAQMATQVLAGRSRLGAAAALMSLTRSIGATLGTAAFGGIALALAGADALQTATPAHAAQVTHAFHLVFGALAVFVALAAVAAARAPRIDLRELSHSNT